MAIWKHFTYLAVIAALAGGLIAEATKTHSSPSMTQVSNSTPWYCQSLANLKKFQDENPTLGVWCANTPGK